MKRFGRFLKGSFKKFRNRLKDIGREAADGFVRDVIRRLAGELLGRITDRTPVGQYPRSSGKVGGTLKRGWTGGEDMDPVIYADNKLEIIHADNSYTIRIINPTEYASYVEYGHRTVDHRSWVPGEFMMTISEDEIRENTAEYLEQKLMDFLERPFRK